MPLRITAPLKERVEDRGADFPAEKTPDADLNRYIGCKSARYSILLLNLISNTVQIFSGTRRQSVQPLRDLRRGVFAGEFSFHQLGCEIVDPRKELRIQRADRAEALGAGRVAVRMRPGRIDD